MTADLPQALAALVGGLEDRGFVVTTDHTNNDTFGDRLIELRSRARHGGHPVRLVKDRGLWEVEIKLGREWHGSYAVMQALRAAPYSRRAESHEERSATTLAVVDALAARAVPVRTLKRRLRGYRRDYWARFGVGSTE